MLLIAVDATAIADLQHDKEPCYGAVVAGQSRFLERILACHLKFKWKPKNALTISALVSVIL